MGRMRMQFGSSEEINCLSGIERFEIPVKDGSVEVCYAARLVTDALILPWRIYVKDYVFDPGGDTYYTSNQESIEYLQSEGTLPNPIPEYSFTNADLFSGNMLWIFIGFLLAYNGIRSFFVKEESSEKGKTD